MSISTPCQNALAGVNLCAMPLGLQPTLPGALITLRPAVAEDFEPLYGIASDPELWAQHPQRDRWQRPIFEQLFHDGLTSRGMLVAVDRANGSLVGSSRFYDLNESEQALTVGYTFVARSAWGTGVNSEMKQLMLDYAFGWAETVCFYVGIDNLRSRKAVEKLGARYLRSEQRHWAVLHAIYTLSREDWQQHQRKGWL
jgi:RimJ/RimL family protein N-acetyltransferase